MKKTYRKHINIIVSFLFIASLLSQSFYGNGIVIKAEQRVEKTETEETRREIKSERTEYSTTYEVGDGKIETEIYPSEVRYVDKETGRLVDYDTSLKKVYRDETTLGTDIKDDYAFENERGDRKHYFPEKLEDETPVITEYKDYQFSMAPLASNDSEASMEDIKEVEDLYGNVSEKSNLVVYEDIKENMDIEIYSMEDGIKENIILKEKPDNNVFYYTINTVGCYPEIETITAEDSDKTYNQIKLVDKKSKETVGLIPSGFMYDSSETGNYTDDCYYTLRKKAKNEYVLGIVVSEEYLCDENTVYPVTVDPTLTWQGSSCIDGTFVADARQQAANYYSSTSMYVGRYALSNAQTYIKFPYLYNYVKNNSVYRMELYLTETADSSGTKKIEFYDVTAPWNAKAMTFNSKPANKTSRRTYFNTKGKANTTSMIPFVSYLNAIRSEIKGSKNDIGSWGFVLKTSSYDSSQPMDAAAFYSPRATTASYRPKVILYSYEKPTAPESVTISAYKTGNDSLNITYTGVESKILDYVQYKVEKYDDATGKVTTSSAEKLNYSTSTKLGTTSCGMGIIDLGTNLYKDGGCFKVSVRGVDKNGIAGKETYAYIHIDKTAPVIKTFSITDTETSYGYVREQPTLKWEIDEIHISDVYIQCNDEKNVRVGNSVTGKYTVPYAFLKEGYNKCILKAVDMAGNEKVSDSIAIYYDSKAPILEGKLSISTSPVNYTNRKDAEYSIWADEKLQIQMYSVNDAPYKLCANKGTLPVEMFEGEPGLKTIKFKGIDNSYTESNEVEFKYYYDAKKPEVYASIYPRSTPHSYLSIIPSITYSVTEDTFEYVKISLPGTDKSITTTKQEDEITIPADWFTQSGNYSFKITAYDNAGNQGETTLDYYYNNENVTADNYVPEEIVINERLDDSTELIWDKVYSENLPSDISYTIYKGTSEDKINTLVAENIKSNTYVIDNQNPAQKYYYKVFAKKNMPTGVEYDSASSKVVYSTTYAADEKEKRLGNRKNLQYIPFELPCGTGKVERSKGNFSYSQLDLELAGDDSNFIFTRNYNSLSGRTGILGKGWMSWYERRIYLNKNKNELICENGDGSYYKYNFTDKTKQAYKSDVDDSNTIFIKDDGTYEQVYKDGSKYVYNANGRMTSCETQDGQKIELTYNLSGSYVDIITFYHKAESEYVKDMTVSLEYQKNDDGLTLLKTAHVSNGASVSYTYSGNKLTKVVVTGENGEGKLQYSYGYNDNGMIKVIKDATADKNEYKINYSTYNKAVECIYPDKTKYCISYDDINKESEYYKKTAANKTLYTSLGKYNEDGYFITLQEGSETIRGGVLYAYEYENHKLSKHNKTIDYSTLVGNAIKKRTDTVGDVFEYERDGNVTTEEYADGTVITYTYGQSGTITKNLPTEIVKIQKDKVNGTEKKLEHVKISYDSKGNVILLTDVINNIDVEFIYNDSNQITECNIKKEGVFVAGEIYEYDEQGKLSSHESEEGTVKNTMSYAYDNSGADRIKTETSSSDGIVTEYEYDSFGRTITVTEKTENKKDKTITICKYDENGNVIEETQPSGVVNKYTYDCMNRVVKEEEISKSSTYATYTSYDYTDVTIRVSDIELIDGSYYTKTYDCVLCTTVKDEDGYVISKTYSDGLGHTIREEKDGVYTDYLYDNQGNVVSSLTYAEGDKKVTTEAFSYDKNGNLTETLINPHIYNDVIEVTESTIVNKNIYDEFGSLVTKEDALGNAVTYRYTEDKKLSEIWLPDDRSASRKYQYSVKTDETLFADIITDIKGSTSKTVSNAAGQVMYVEDKGYDGTSIKKSYEYDSLGNVSKETNGNGSYIVYTYDKENQCIEEKAYDKSGVLQNNTCYTYDNMNNLIRMDDYKSEDGKMNYVCSTHYRYNDLGELTAEGQIDVPISESPSDEDIEACLTRYTYNNKGMMIQKDYPENEDGIVSEFYEYNKKNQLITVKALMKGSSAKVTVAEYSYTPRGELEKVTQNLSPADSGSDKLIRKYTYDIFGCVSDIEYSKKSDGKVFERYSYAYDSNFNIVYETITGETTQVREYTYSSKGQLVRTDITVDGVKKEPYIYEYDSVGNCVTMTNGNTETMEYNGLNQLVKKLDNGGSTGKTTYQYDGSGNQTGVSVSSPVAIYTDTRTYDPYNRLTATNRTYPNNSKVLLQKNTYNGDGQRVASTFTSGGNTTTEYYHYTEGQLSYMKDVAGTTTGKYIYNDEGGVLLREEKKTSGTGKSYISYTKDIRGSAKTLLSQTGKKLVSYDYNDYGETIVRTAADNTSKVGYGNHLCYTGGVYDKATGMYYLNARYYDPSVAGFITQDSYRGTYEDAKTWNLYGYCAGNPVGYTDPTGHAVETIFDIISLGSSIFELIKNPSWANAGYLGMDIGATILPFVPGSYTVKGVKAAANVVDTATDVVKAVDTVNDITKTFTKLSDKTIKYVSKQVAKIDTYKELKKLYKGKSGIEVHHILEKRLLPGMKNGIKKGNMASIPLEKEVHREITNRWRKVIPYGSKYKKLNKDDLITAVEKVYFDMPKLKEKALECVNDYYE